MFTTMHNSCLAANNSEPVYVIIYLCYVVVVRDFGSGFSGYRAACPYHRYLGRLLTKLSEERVKCSSSVALHAWEYAI